MLSCDRAEPQLSGLSKFLTYSLEAVQCVGGLLVPGGITTISSGGELILLIYFSEF